MPFGKLLDNFTGNSTAVMSLLVGAVATVMILPFLLRRNRRP